MRFGYDIRRGDEKKGLCECQRQRTGGRDKRGGVCLVRQHRQILLGDLCRLQAIELELTGSLIWTECEALRRSVNRRNRATQNISKRTSQTERESSLIRPRMSCAALGHAPARDENNGHRDDDCSRNVARACVN